MMLEEIPLTDLFPYIQIAFDGDSHLHIYHISDSNYATHTYHEICKTAEILSLTCYKVGEYGFTVTSPGLLYSFGINVKHRDKKTLESWFFNLRNILGSFDCCLHAKNSRAINHLVKQGMEIKDEMIVLTIK